MGHQVNYDEASVKAPGDKWNGAMSVAAGLGIVLLVLAYFLRGDSDKFMHGYLTAFMFFLSISLGALGFVLIQHVTRAGWSVVVRRIIEGFMKNLILMALLFIPIAVCAGEIFAWADSRPATAEVQADTAHSEEHGEAKAIDHSGVHKHGDKLVDGEHKEIKPEAKDGHADAHVDAGHGDHPATGRLYKLDHKPKVQKHTEHVLHLKSIYLNKGWFYVRAGVYFLIWIGMAIYLFKNSTSQDSDKSVARTIDMGRKSTVGLALFALSLTFAAFDWIMTLEYAWFSTIFGVVYFAGGIVTMFAATIVAIKVLQSKGYLKGAVNQEHYHDLGKFMYAFLVFWTYVAFSQYLIIWYADLIEETIYYQDRMANGWSCMSWAVLFGTFLLPFLIFMSRHTKRNSITCVIFAVWMLIAHYVHFYWEIMPTLNYPGTTPFAFHIADLLTLVGMGGIFVGGFIFFIKDQNLIPVGDPRLNESLSFTNY